MLEFQFECCVQFMEIGGFSSLAEIVENDSHSYYSFFSCSHLEASDVRLESCVETPRSYCTAKTAILHNQICEWFGNRISIVQQHI